MPFTSIYRKPDGSFFRYSLNGRTLREEQRLAAQFDGSPHFGEYCYSRTIEQAPLDTVRRYQLTPTRGQLRYQAIDEDLPGQFDYIRFGGAHQDICRLPVTCPVTVDGLGSKASLMLYFDIKAAHSHQFKDLCSKYVFAVSFSSGEALLLGYTSESANTPSVKIPLTLVV